MQCQWVQWTLTLELFAPQLQAVRLNFMHLYFYKWNRCEDPMKETANQLFDHLESDQGSGNIGQKQNIINFIMCYQIQESYTSVLSINYTATDPD